MIVNEYGYICIVIDRPLSAETNGNVMYYLTLLPTRNANIKLAITTLRNDWITFIETLFAKQH